jgi:hypothetical protein
MAEVEQYPCDMDNIFSECNTEERLNKKYQKFVRQYGTNTMINAQYTERLKELDIMFNANRKYKSKDLLHRRSKQFMMDSFNS